MALRGRKLSSCLPSRNTANYLAPLLIILLSILRSEGKTLQGAISSRQAWADKGTFITKFCFHDRKALFRYETNATSPGGRWYFYLDEHWQGVVTETNCTEKLLSSRFSVSIGNTQGEQYVNQWIRPHFWYIVYADASTCGPESPTNDFHMGYTLSFFNPDSYGDATDHFGEDEKGLLTMFSLLVVVYLAGIAFFARQVWMSIQKGGPMHEVLQMLSVAIAMHFLSAVLMLIHLWIYKSDGVGSGFCETVSEILEEMSQLVMVWMLLSLSLGWTLGTGTSSGHPVKDTRQLLVVACVAVTEVVLVLWEQMFDESHYTYHVHESLPGVLLVLLRVALAGLFAFNLSFTVANERSVLRRNFYQTFSFACYVWFLVFPVLMLIAMVLPEYWRHRMVTIGTAAVQSLAMLILSRQFLSRSLYWEVSTLSSTTLPLKRDRGRF